MKLDEKRRMPLRYLTVLIVITAVIAAVLGIETAAAETHKFFYEVSSNDSATITATCQEEGCNVRATLMISAPANLICDGRDKAATVTGDTAMLGTPTITYRKGNEVLEGTPRDAGTYTASITLGEGDNTVTASVSYTIILTSPFCGTIKWLDGGKDHTDTTPPALTLYRAKGTEDGTPVTNVTLRWNKNNTIFTYEDLPMSDDSGDAYTYWVVESQVVGYMKPEYSNKGTNPPEDCLMNAGTITNSIQQEKITLKGGITWNHGSNPEAVRPQTVTVHLQAVGTDLPNKFITLDGIMDNRTDEGNHSFALTDYELAPVGGTWNFEFTGLDKYDSTGTEVIYSVREEYVPNYKTAYDNAHCNITNTFNTNTLGEILKVHTEVTVPANCDEWNWAANNPTFVFGLFGASNTAGVMQPMPFGSVYGDEVCKRIEVTRDSAEHEASFGAVSFDVPGTYVYYVREMTPAEPLPGMTYNTEVYTVTVVVNNSMNISVTVTNKAGETIKSVGGQYNLTEKNDSYVLPFTHCFDMKKIDYTMAAEMAYADHSKLDDSGYPLNVIGEVNGKFDFTMRPVGEKASDAPMPTDDFNSGTGCGLKYTGDSRVYYARNVNNRVLFGADEARVIEFDGQHTGTYTYELAEIIPNGAVYIDNGFWYNDADETVYDGVVHTIKLQVNKAESGAITVTPSEEKACYLNPDMGTKYKDAGNATEAIWTDTDEYPRHKNGVPQFYNYREPRIDITASKVWDDANNKDNRRPQNVYFYIEREDGQPIKNVYGNVLTVDETKVKIAGTDLTDCSLKAVWSNLLRYKRTGYSSTYEQITYKVFESANGEPRFNSVPGYANQVITGDDEKGFTITNSMKAPAAIPGLVYNGGAQELITPGDASGSTFWYALGESADTEPVGKFYTISTPTATDAGTWYVWYKAIGDENHNSTGVYCQEVTIDPAPITDASVTLSATNLDYSSFEQTVTVTEVKLGDTVLTAGTDYEVTGETAGTNKGTYTVTVTGKGNYKDSATATWSIGMAVPTINTAPTASAITYGQRLTDSTLSGGTAKNGNVDVEGTFAWKNAATAPAVSDSETTEYDVVFNPTDTENYGAAECKVKLAVNKADSVPAAVTANSRTYDGTEKPLATVDDTMLDGGEMQYAFGTATEATQAYTNSIPAKTDAGTYYVWYKVAGDENHNDTESDVVTVKIMPVNRESLISTVSEARAYYNDIKDNDDYAQTAKGLLDAITNAEAVMENDNVKESDIRTALTAIVDAIADARAQVKETDDTKAADFVADMINSLPAADGIKAADKGAIEEARKAYDSLTEDQKAKISADVLKKLTDAQKALEDIDKKPVKPVDPSSADEVMAREKISRRKMEEVLNLLNSGSAGIHEVKGVYQTGLDTVSVNYVITDGKITQISIDEKSLKDGENYLTVNTGVRLIFDDAFTISGNSVDEKDAKKIAKFVKVKKKEGCVFNPKRLKSHKGGSYQVTLTCGKKELITDVVDVSLNKKAIKTVILTEAVSQGAVSANAVAADKIGAEGSSVSGNVVTIAASPALKTEIPTCSDKSARLLTGIWQVGGTYISAGEAKPVTKGKVTVLAKVNSDGTLSIGKAEGSGKGSLKINYILSGKVKKAKKGTKVSPIIYKAKVKVK